MRRTKENLDLSDAIQQRVRDFWEVTFLVNSLLGLIVVPSETLIEEMSQLPVQRDGIPKWEAHFIIDGDPVPGDLRRFMKGLRNAVAHFSVLFITADGDISGVRFQTYENVGADVPRWRATFSIEELHTFLDKLAQEVDSAWLRRWRRS